MPKKPRPAERAIEKQDAWAAAISSSGLVPGSFSKRVVNPYFTSFSAPLPYNIPPGGRFTPGMRRTDEEVVQVIGLRRKIAEKMQDAKRRIPHFAYVEEADLTELEELRAHLNATKRNDQPKLTLLPFLMRALTLCLPAAARLELGRDKMRQAVEDGRLTLHGLWHDIGEGTLEVWDPERKGFAEV